MAEIYAQAVDPNQAGPSTSLSDPPHDVLYASTLPGGLLEDPCLATGPDLDAAGTWTALEPAGYVPYFGNDRLCASMELFMRLSSNAVPGSRLRLFFDGVFAHLDTIAEQYGAAAQAHALLEIVQADLIPRDTDFFCLSLDPSEEIAIYDAIAAECSIPAMDNVPSE